MKLIKEINPENINATTASTYDLRTAARAVLFDNENNIGLLHVKKHGYHKIPGGGVEKGEDIKTALVRECSEEAGCKIEIGEEVGSIVEYRGKYMFKQISECFIAYVKGEKNSPEFTEEEINENFELIWVSVNEAESLLEHDSPKDYEGKFIVDRDLTFIQEARKVIE